MNAAVRFAGAFLLAVLGPAGGCGPERPATSKAVEVRPNENTPNDRKANRNAPAPAAAKDDTFVVADLASVELKQGGSKAFDVAIRRGADSKSEVKFSLRPPAPPAGTGVTFSPADWMLKSDESTASVTAKATPDAAVGTFTWTLVVRPRVGKETTHTMTVVVNPK